MAKYVKIIISMTLPAVVVCGLLLLPGCEGSEAKKTVTETVEQAVGVETAKKGRQVKQDVNQSMQQEMERARRDIQGNPADNQGAVPEESQKTE